MSLVCIDCRYVNGRPSGIGEMVAALVARVPHAAPDLRFRLLVSPDAPGRISDAPNVEQVIVRASANGPGTMWWLSRAADLRGVDVFHATYNIMPASLTMPCITTIHDLMWLERPNWCDDSWLMPVRRAFFRHGIRRALNRSAFIATVSEATRESVIFAKPDAAARTTTIASGVSETFRPEPASPRTLAVVGIDPRRRFVLMVGQSAPYKNHVGALHAFALVCAKREDVDLVLVQRQGPDPTRLLGMAGHLGIRHRVRVVPPLAQDQLRQLYTAASLLLHPSLSEGFGHPLAEAMACGCPVITSDRSAMLEVTDDAALLVEPCDAAAIAAAIVCVLDDSEVAAAMRQRGFARAAQLDWKKSALAYVALYRRALAGSDQASHAGAAFSQTS